MFDLWWYQRDTLDDCQISWAEGAQVVMPVLPTGSGKTVVIGQAAKEHDGDGFAMAHRSELVSQISVALGRAEIPHNIVASEAVIRTVKAAHYAKLGRLWYDPRAEWHVGSVDTVIRREIPKLRKPLIIQDEGHHVLRANKWGKAFSMFPPNSLGMFPTATPGRADGRGLGREYDGLVDALIVGPGMRDLINIGMLTDYDVLAPDCSDLDLTDVDITASGELNLQQAAAKMRQSRKLVGNIVDTYLAYARGRLGVTFAVDIDAAKRITEAFNAAGVPCAMITGEDGEDYRRKVLEDFEARKYMMLVNVDLFGEGFDLPAIEVVIMARPTESFPLYAQQWGRALRLMVEKFHMDNWGKYTDAQRLGLIAMSSKPRALIIDHVGNIIRHKGPPDRPRVHTLARRDKKKDIDDAIPLTSCKVCAKPYERIYPVCPYCGTPRPLPEPNDRTLQMIDGQLSLLSAEQLARMRSEIIDVKAPPYVPASVVGTHYHRNAIDNVNRRNRSQQNLRHVIDTWAAIYRNEPQEVRERRFYLTFNLDVVSAMGLGAKEARALTATVLAKIESLGYEATSLPFESECN